MRVYCETYGCTANFGDGELILGQLAAAGHEVVSSLADADVVIVNTCAVKGETHRKMLRRLQELRKVDGKRVIVAGCLPLIDRASIERLGAFDGMISCKSIGAIAEVVEGIERGEPGAWVLHQPPCEKPAMPKLRSSRVSAIVAICEGCTSNCSYCSVKLARGALRSFSPESILGEVRAAVDAGYGEILLTAQDTAAYGLDIGTNLAELLNLIASIDGEFMVRVGMMNPKNAKPILDGLLEAYEGERIYKFLHLPVQSGSDRILGAMRREYTVDDFLEIVREFRRRFEDLQLATDIIVGFPGEDELDFARTCELLERVRPDKTNVSKFSPMPGTDAARMPQLDAREIASRSRAASELCRRITYEQNRRYLGRVARGLVTGQGAKGGYTVRLPNYKLAITPSAEVGSFVDVRITAARPTYLLAEAA